jgi:hypothetical protein
MESIDFMSAVWYHIPGLTRNARYLDVGWNDGDPELGSQRVPKLPRSLRRKFTAIGRDG